MMTKAFEVVDGFLTRAAYTLGYAIVGLVLIRLWKMVAEEL